MPGARIVEKTGPRTFEHTPSPWSFGPGGFGDFGEASDAALLVVAPGIGVVTAQQIGIADPTRVFVTFGELASGFTPVWRLRRPNYLMSRRSAPNSRAEFDAVDVTWSAIRDDPVSRTSAVLNELRDLEDDWDSYGGLPPTEKSLETARALILSTGVLYGVQVGYSGIPDDIAPIPRGGVQMEWRGTNAYLEVEIGPDGVPSYLLKHLQPDGSRRYSERHGVGWSELFGKLNEVLMK